MCLKVEKVTFNLNYYIKYIKGVLKSKNVKIFVRECGWIASGVIPLSGDGSWWNSMGAII